MHIHTHIYVFRHAATLNLRFIFRDVKKKRKGCRLKIRDVTERSWVGGGGILPQVLHGTASSAGPYLTVLLLARGEEELVREEEEKAVPAQNTNREQKKKKPRA